MLRSIGKEERVSMIGEANHGAESHAGTVRRVVLLHGLWMPRLSMHWLAARLREAGFEPETFGYASVATGPDPAIPRLVQRLREAPTHVVAHSLGGLVTLTALEQYPDLPVVRVVCLGSPLCGSTAAQGLPGRVWSAASAPLLRRGCAPWSGRAEVGLIAGNVPMGLGRYVGQFREDNDGTVTVAETRLSGLADHAVLPASHSGLLFSAQVARQTVEFLHRGRFAG